jgi:hypothetical protein
MALILRHYLNHQLDGYTTTKFRFGVAMICPRTPRNAFRTKTQTICFGTFPQYELTRETRKPFQRFSAHLKL